MTIKTNILINELRLEADLNPQHIMANWVESVERLYVAFDQLKTCATNLVAENTADAYTGQCPTFQLFQLMKDMNQQLAQLLERTDHLPSLTNLSAHTVLINALTTRAAVLIQLFSWSAS